MSFFDSISKFFGFGPKAAEGGTWPRVVGLNELPPSRLPIVPPHLRASLPLGIREVTGPDHQSWQPWKSPLEQRDRETGRTMMDFLRDGAVRPPDCD
jgi:hypothetical protein